MGKKARFERVYAVHVPGFPRPVCGTARDWLREAAGCAVLGTLLGTLLAALLWLGPVVLL